MKNLNIGDSPGKKQFSIYKFIHKFMFSEKNSRICKYNYLCTMNLCTFSVIQNNYHLSSKKHKWGKERKKEDKEKRREKILIIENSPI